MTAKEPSLLRHRQVYAVLVVLERGDGAQVVFPSLGELGERGWNVGPLLPVMNVVPTGMPMMVAVRFLYASFVAIAIVVAAIIDLAHVLGFHALAEGVEHATQAEVLRQQGHRQVAMRQWNYVMVVVHKRALV